MPAKAQKVVVITGASSGIGRAAALEFARHGYSVVAIARRKDRLDSLVDQMKKEHRREHFWAVPCDLSDWKRVSGVAEDLREKLPYVNVLVNNAGAYEYKSLEKTPAEKIDEVINVNVRGVIYMSKVFLPLLKRAAAGGHRAKIVNVSSIGGLWGFSNMTVYTATKFAVTGFSSALRRELRAEGIEVASIHPGPVHTKEGEEPARKRPVVMLPDQIARQIYLLAKSKKAQRISHPAFSLLHLLEYFSPPLVDRVLKKIL